MDEQNCELAHELSAFDMLLSRPANAFLAGGFLFCQPPVPKPCAGDETLSFSRKQMSEELTWKSVVVVAAAGRLTIEEHMSVPPVPEFPHGRFLSAS
jgi:hypothetical protein